MRIVPLLLAAPLFACMALAGAACDRGDDDNQSKPGIYLFDLTTSAVSKTASGDAFALSWTDDGGAIWYATNFLPGTNGELRSLAQPKHTGSHVADLNNGGFASISAGRGVAAYVAREQDGFYVETATEAARLRYGPGIGAELSPDGSRLLYLSPPCVPAQQLFVAPADSKAKPRSVASGAFSASWLPDGRIAYSQQQADPGLPATQMILDADLNGARSAFEVLGVAPNGAYFVSPDAARVLYGGDPNRILLRDITAATDVDLGPGRSALVGWSPDSRFVAYASFDVLHVVSAADGVERYTVDLLQISDETAKPFALAWSPDSARIAISTAVLPSGAACAAATPPTVEASLTP